MQLRKKGSKIQNYKFANRDFVPKFEDLSIEHHKSPPKDKDLYSQTVTHFNYLNKLFLQKCHKRVRQKTGQKTGQKCYCSV